MPQLDIFNNTYWFLILCLTFTFIELCSLYFIPVLIRNPKYIYTVQPISKLRKKPLHLIFIHHERAFYNLYSMQRAYIALKVMQPHGEKIKNFLKTIRKKNKRKYIKLDTTYFNYYTTFQWFKRKGWSNFLKTSMIMPITNQLKINLVKMKTVESKPKFLMQDLYSRGLLLPETWHGPSPWHLPTYFDPVDKIEKEREKREKEGRYG